MKLAAIVLFLLPTSLFCQHYSSVVSNEEIINFMEWRIEQLKRDRRQLDVKSLTIKDQFIKWNEEELHYHSDGADNATILGCMIDVASYLPSILPQEDRLFIQQQYLSIQTSTLSKKDFKIRKPRSALQKH
jgi:hypothetical protein